MLNPILHLVCGKAGSGKSTLCNELAKLPQTVLISEDLWLSTLFGDQLSSIDDYVRLSQKLRGALGPHIIDILQSGTSVVLDFPANTTKLRAWMLDLASEAQITHQLHFLDVPDDLCKSRLRARNISGDHPFSVSDAQFDQLAAYFEPPSTAEGLTILRHID